MTSKMAFVGLALGLALVVSQVSVASAAGLNQTVTTTCTPTAPTGTPSTPTASTTEANQPVGEALAAFFCQSLGADYATIQQWHKEGFGYGVIAQALFMAQVLGGDATLAQEILTAKQTHDFSGLTLPDGATPSNWGQLMKDVLGAGVRSMTNLGAIMSGRATPPTPPATRAAPANGHGHGGGHGHGNGNGNGHRP